MSLVIEDGSGVTGANTFVSLVDARALAFTYGYTISADDTEAEEQLKSAYLYLVSYESTLQGSRSTSIQRSIFPRTGVLNALVANTPSIDADSIPEQVKLAQIVTAQVINGGVSLYNVAASGELKSFEVVGVYKEEYKDGRSGETKTRVVISEVADLLKAFTIAELNRYNNGFCTVATRENYGYMP